MKSAGADRGRLLLHEHTRGVSSRFAAYHDAAASSAEPGLPPSTGLSRWHALGVGAVIGVLIVAAIHWLF